MQRQFLETLWGLASSRAENAYSYRGRRNIQGFSNIPNHCAASEGNHKVRTFVTRGKRQKHMLQCQPDLATRVHSISATGSDWARNATPEFEFADQLFQKALELGLFRWRTRWPTTPTRRTQTRSSRTSRPRLRHKDA